MSPCSSPTFRRTTTRQLILQHPPRVRETQREVSQFVQPSIRRVPDPLPDRPTHTTSEPDPLCPLHNCCFDKLAEVSTSAVACGRKNSERDGNEDRQTGRGRCEFMNVDANLTMLLMTFPVPRKHIPHFLQRQWQWQCGGN